MPSIAVSPKRLPLGNPDFAALQDQHMIYVDKTKLIEQFAKQTTPLFFSRPRRFGKSLLINTLKSLFRDGLRHFRHLEIEKTWHDKTYKVIHLDFSNLDSTNSQNFKRDLVATILQQFGLVNTIKAYDELGIRGPNIIINEIAEKLSNNSVVLLIDEYDAPLTHNLDNPERLNEIINTLNLFYSAIKLYTGKFRLIFITGIIRASHVSIFSAFNNLIDISLDDDVNELLGFTQTDIENFFAPYVENAATALNMSTSDVYERMAQYYDGFQFSLNASKTIYNPWSVLSFLKYPKKGFKNYWFKSADTSSLVMQYLKVNDTFNPLNYEGSSLFISEDQLSERYEITKIPSDILLFQTGYLTIRKKTHKLAELIFPNTEVEDSILQLQLAARDLHPDIENYCNIDRLIQYIDTNDLNSIISIFNAILNDCVSNDGNIFNDERSVRDIIYAALPQAIELQKSKERTTLKGRSDLELLTSKTHMVIEFKRTKPNLNAQAALQAAIKQMKINRYGIGSFQSHKLYRVAMVISTEEKAILANYAEAIDSILSKAKS